MMSEKLNAATAQENTPLVRLANLIYLHSGLNYQNNLFTLEPKAAKRFKELGLDCAAYLEFLERSPLEWEVLMQHVTINETYFFREEAQLNELVKIAQRTAPGSEIRIWSSACSTGEEPYSLGMMLEKHGITRRNPVSIIGSDINLRVIKTASEAFYSASSLCFRRTGDEQKKAYFTEETGGYRVNPSIRELVEFRRVNLLNDDQVESIGPVDVIFCRNVMIYFDMETIRTLVDRFHRLLKPGGYLFLGHAETLRGLDCGFETVKENDTFFYRKG
ncbi:CheR family methyltransferase [Saccharibacillus kuerlensis]|uniref:Chemotaxis protein methyltransferase n=1 Tax=Saccharibacillus kuerlensis TaxID=459527 RepID=A0ABQ2L6G3_9BACL|nr:protein-glutamate O-methyltransferase CheR [Saccharibacillus kuerlensis]GGO01609.1 chemotaxis protein methyltransferase [Saccharibacillus kuerlensis]